MELTNATYKYLDGGEINIAFIKDVLKQFIQLMAPFAPHFAEELWERAGYEYSVFNTEYPVCDETKLVKNEVEYPLQINGKVRARFSVAKDMSKDDVEKYVRENYASLLDGKNIVKFIVVPGRIVNVVIK